MNYINIEPKEIIISATKMKIDIVNIQLNQCAIIRVSLLDNSLKIVQTNELVLKNDEYDAWQSDTDLISIICNKYSINLN